MLFELWVQMFQMWREQVVFAGYLQNKDIHMFGMQRARSHNGLVYLRILQHKMQCGCGVRAVMITGEQTAS